jgi:hypothetical protein
MLIAFGDTRVLFHVVNSAPVCIIGVCYSCTIFTMFLAATHFVPSGNLSYFCLVVRPLREPQYIPEGQLSIVTVFHTEIIMNQQ